MILPLLMLLGCGDKSADSATEVEYLNAYITLRSLNDRPQIEIETRSGFDNQTIATEEDGTVTLPVEPNSPFIITAQENDSLQHRYVGNTTERDFALDALFLDRGTWTSLLGNVELSEEVGRGHLWVSVVNANFLPIAGASVSLEGNPSAPPFVLLETNFPWSTNTIDETGKATVFFPNISPQDVTVQVTPPNGETCRLFVDDANSNQATATIYANTATILWFICQ